MLKNQSLPAITCQRSVPGSGLSHCSGQFKPTLTLIMSSRAHHGTERQVQIDYDGELQRLERESSVIGEMIAGELCRDSAEINGLAVRNESLRRKSVDFQMKGAWRRVRLCDPVVTCTEEGAEHTVATSVDELAHVLSLPGHISNCCFGNCNNVPAPDYTDSHPRNEKRGKELDTSRKPLMVLMLLKLTGPMMVTGNPKQHEPHLSPMHVRIRFTTRLPTATNLQHRADHHVWQVHVACDSTSTTHEHRDAIIDVKMSLKPSVAACRFAVALIRCGLLGRRRRVPRSISVVSKQCVSAQPHGPSSRFRYIEDARLAEPHGTGRPSGPSFPPPPSILI